MKNNKNNLKLSSVGKFILILQVLAFLSIGLFAFKDRDVNSDGLNTVMIILPFILTYLTDSLFRLLSPLISNPDSDPEFESQFIMLNNNLFMISSLIAYIIINKTTYFNESNVMLGIFILYAVLFILSVGISIIYLLLLNKQNKDTHSKK